jgi:hypothetical protein
MGRKYLVSWYRPPYESSYSSLSKADPSIVAAGQAAWATPIAHFDIKFGNCMRPFDEQSSLQKEQFANKPDYIVLFGDHVGTHTRLPILKVEMSLNKLFQYSDNA